MKLIAESRTRPKPGEFENGDLALIRHFGDRTLLAVVDALGHGPLAAEVAHAAAGFLQAADLTQRAETLLSGLHGVLARGRGAVGSLCLFDGAEFDYGGVGNVEIRAAGLSLGPHQSAGILGHSTIRIRTYRSPAQVGQRLLLFSDGIQEHFSLSDFSRMAIGDVCGTLLDRYARPTDDVAVLVAEVQA